MSACPWMFLVRVQTGLRPRVFRVDPMELRSVYRGAHVLIRREPRVWAMKRGVAAVAYSVEQAFELIATLSDEAKNLDQRSCYSYERCTQSQDREVEPVSSSAAVLP